MHKTSKDEGVLLHDSGVHPVNCHIGECVGCWRGRGMEMHNKVYSTFIPPLYKGSGIGIRVLCGEAGLMPAIQRHTQELLKASANQSYYRSVCLGDFS